MRTRSAGAVSNAAAAITQSRNKVPKQAANVKKTKLKKATTVKSSKKTTVQTAPKVQRETKKTISSSGAALSPSIIPTALEHLSQSCKHLASAIDTHGYYLPNVKYVINAVLALQILISKLVERSRMHL
eukprot:m.71863 g.71863  ORF g.71863 m.71863 type:complete len:129 (-) comp12282_c0_seq1:602-988(-)